jgi:hypothetical protein
MPWRVWRRNPVETLRFTLRDPVEIDRLRIRWRPSFFATDYTVKGSITGFGSLATLWGADVGGPLDIVGNPVQELVHLPRDPGNTNAPARLLCLEIEATEFFDQSGEGYYITHEIQAFGPATIEQKGGYNMFVERDTLGVMTADMKRNVDDNPANAVDLNVGSYVRGTFGDPDGTNCWFVVPLSEAAEAMAMSLGMWEEQPWSDAQVYVSADETYTYVNDGGDDTWSGMTWTQVYDHSDGFLWGTHFTFEPSKVKYIRVQWPADDYRHRALCEIELFETYAVKGTTIVFH